MGVTPLQTRLPGEQYLKTFDAQFQVHREAPVRTSPFSNEPLPEYRAQVFSRFEASKGIAIDVHA